MSEQVRAGTLKLADFFEAESCMHRSHGHCMTMGTASTMASMVEALGIGLPGNAAYPAVDGRRNVIARNAGRRIVDMVHEDQKISQVLTREAFENAIVVNSAIGGSTNCVPHLVAVARHIGVPLQTKDWETVGHSIPLLANIQPAGEFLSEAYYRAGGVPAIIGELNRAGKIHVNAMTVTGRTIGSNCESAGTLDPQVIRRFDDPLMENAGLYWAAAACSVSNCAVRRLSALLALAVAAIVLPVIARRES
jgi:dihydroxy-acid dehydratase